MRREEDEQRVHWEHRLRLHLQLLVRLSLRSGLIYGQFLLVPCAYLQLAALEGESEEGGGVDQLKWASPTGDYHWLVSHNLWGVCLPIALHAIFVVFGNWRRGS